MSAEYDAALEITGAIQSLTAEIDMPRMRERIATAVYSDLLTRYAVSEAAYRAVCAADALMKAFDIQEPAS